MGIVSQRLRELVDRGVLLAVLALVVYLVLAPAHIVDGDNAEFSTLARTGGTAHPTGYPLYLLWLRATSWLPGASPAHTAALATAVLGAATVLVLHAACRAWGARPLGATIAAALFGGAPIIMRIATTAEVFALNCLVVAAVLWLAAREGPLRGAWRAAVLGLVAGLGLANHMTCVLVAPVGILGVVRAVREAPAARAIGLAAAGLAIGLLPYAYLIVTPDTPLSWGKVETLGDVYAMFTRQDYGGPGSFLPTATEVPASRQLAAFALALGRTWLWLPLALGLATLGWHAVRAREGEPRWGWAMLAVSWLLAGPLLVVRFNIEPAGLGLYVSQRFYVLPALLLAVPIAVGLRVLDPFVARSRLFGRALTAGVSVLGFAAVVATTLPYLARMHTPAVERYAQNVLAVLPRDAVLFIGQDDEYFGASYVQWALGERQDVTLVAPQLTSMPWYAARVARRGIAAPPGEGHPMIRVVDKLLAEGRPVFVEKRRAEVIDAFPTYPFGTVMKVQPRGTRVPPIDAVVEENKAIYARFQLGYPPPGPDDEFATAIHHRYAATWMTLGRKLEAAGKAEAARWAFEVARSIGPKP